MKILFVDLQYDYGVQSRGPNLIGQHGFLEPFIKLGHEVTPFYYDSYLTNKAELQKQLILAADRVKPDLIYFIIFQDQFEFETLDLLKRKYRTINWFGDDSWRFDSYTQKYAPHFSICVTTDFFSVRKYQNLGVPVVLSQWAAYEHTSHNIEAESKYEYDVSFVGGTNFSRRWFIKELSRRGIQVNCFGFGWGNGIVSADKMIKIFKSSKINLNLSNSKNHDYRSLFSSPRNFAATIKSDKVASQIKARNFEIPYYGGFQLTDYVPSLENYFHIGKELVCYKDIDEAEMLIRFYLENSEPREKIKHAGILRAINEHSYYHRHQEIFKAL